LLYAKVKKGGSPRRKPCQLNVRNEIKSFIPNERRNGKVHVRERSRKTSGEVKLITPRGKNRSPMGRINKSNMRGSENERARDTTNIEGAMSSAVRKRNGIPTMGVIGSYGIKSD